MQKVKIIKETEFWIMFYFLSAFYFLAKGDGKSHGTQGQQVGNFQEHVILLLFVLAQCH